MAGRRVVNHGNIRRARARPGARPLVLRAPHGLETRGSAQFAADLNQLADGGRRRELVSGPGLGCHDWGESRNSRAQTGSLYFDLHGTHRLSPTFI